MENYNPSLSSTEELTEEKKPMTPAEYKKAMGQFWTVRRDVVEKCHHKFYGTEPPRNNCPYCWFAHFQTRGEETQIAEECYQKDKGETLKKLKGEKYVKMFLRFMGTLAYMKENNINGFRDGSEREVEADRDGRKEVKQGF